MELRIKRKSMEIIAETEMDTAFLEDTFGIPEDPNFKPAPVTVDHMTEWQTDNREERHLLVIQPLKAEDKAVE